jgi:uncharacterized protein with HEPN domain
VSSRNWQQRVEDIISAIMEIREFTGSVKFDEFASNPILMKAVLYNFIIIGEAVRHIPQEIQDLRPDIPWRVMGGMRNIVAHEYFQLDTQRIWETSTNDVPTLIEPLMTLLES